MLNLTLVILNGIIRFFLKNNRIDFPKNRLGSSRIFVLCIDASCEVVISKLKQIQYMKKINMKAILR